MTSAHRPPDSDPHGISSDTAPATEAAALLALDALDDAERDPHLTRADDTVLADFRQVAAALAEAVAEDAPADLRATVLAAARAKRPIGRPLVDPGKLTPVEAFLRTVGGLHAVLADLTDAEWLLPTALVYGRVRDVVAHLTGVEEGLLGVLGHGETPDPVTWSDHQSATAVWVTSLAHLDTTLLLQRWVRSARRLAEVAATLATDRVVAVNDVPAGVSGMFVLRTFEVWTHHEDICRATGRPLPTLDPPRLRVMSGELIDALPVALAMQGNARPNRTMRLVLTGGGGGTFDRPMAFDTAPGSPDTVIVTNVVDFCRVAARRIAPEQLTATIEGDRELADLVLAAAGAFARD
jgi:uncharacterized protein (TIGR03083 family)